ncbi:DUF4198 domain-containing protein [Telmatospirillum sp. J64-1]|uniref:DUF4198 domain-containing protein n=1 Tax=Telmatospirillum sp. J64-1 TaxID=2502183 RepID=UPI00115EE891|nr:DUF4198 domain-containing protein [Telmatospirillum sp. J64-1]
MKSSLKWAALALGIVAALPTAAQAHRAWLLPSATVLSGEDPWITVDGAISNNLFYFEHFPLQLNGLTIIAPDGETVEAENAHSGKYRSTFDVRLNKQGTYKMAVTGESMMGSYKLNGETKRVRGTAAEPPVIPAEATDVQIRQALRRIETFTTVGSPNETALTTSGIGLEMVPLTHPNDLFAGEEAKFRLLLDGNPAANVDVEVVPGGLRYRSQLGDMKVTTDADGVFSVTWPEAGMYWLQAMVRDENGSIPGTQRTSTYTVTLEALPQ